MSKYFLIFISVAAVLMISLVPAGAVPVYQPVPVDASWGYTEVYDPAMGIEYGKARIEYWYWYDANTSYWHYAYQVFNNDYFATPTDPSDDYHFGWLGSDPDAYDTINKFGVNLDPDGDGLGPSDLVILDTQAGSSAGGGPWGAAPDPNNRGVDWTVSLGSNTPLPIAPTRSEYVRIKGEWQWVTYDGDTSRDDATGQYFQIASRWAPGPATASIVAYVDKEAAGTVMAPVVPEPSSLIALLATSGGFGGLAILRRRRRK